MVRAVLPLGARVARDHAQYEPAAPVASAASAAAGTAAPAVQPPAAAVPPAVPLASQQPAGEQLPASSAASPASECAQPPVLPATWPVPPSSKRSIASVVRPVLPAEPRGCWIDFSACSSKYQRHVCRWESQQWCRWVECELLVGEPSAIASGRSEYGASRNADLGRVRGVSAARRD